MLDSKALNDGDGGVDGGDGMLISAHDGSTKMIHSMKALMKLFVTCTILYSAPQKDDANDVDGSSDDGDDASVAYEDEDCDLTRCY